MSAIRIAVLGAGAVGGYFAARLVHAGYWVATITRGENLAAIRAHGLHVQSRGGGELSASPVLATSEPAEVGAVDGVILAVKAWQVRTAAQAMRPLLGAATKVLPLQNGVEAASELEQALGRRHVLNGLCRIISMLEAPGRIRHVALDPVVVLGEIDDSPLSAPSRAIAEALQHAGITVETPPRVSVALWEKLLFLAPFAGICALARSSIGEVRRAAPAFELLSQLTREVAAVARSTQAALPDDAIVRAVELVATLPADATASMSRDILNGRPSELEAIIGVIVRYGRRSGIRTPAMDAVYAALLPQELRAREHLGVGS